MFGRSFNKYIIPAIIFLAFQTQLFAQRQMEKLGRGVIAVRQSADSVYVGWRMLGTDPDELAFNLYRQSGNASAIKLNKVPLTESTNYVDVNAPAAQSYSYYIKPVLKAKEQEASQAFKLPINSAVQQYLTIPLRTPKGYTPNDISVGDLDGDGAYDIVLHQTGRSRDNSFNGITDPPIFQAYKMDGTFLWEINLGKNIREGAHYTQFMVYDLDGDGIAEFACKTAEGTVDGKGKVIGDATKDWRNANGKILSGPEFFTIFNGKTGEALATTDYIPGRGDIGAWGGYGGNGKNDNTGNRVDRFTACIAYLNGVHPSVVMGRGYYGRTVLAAWDWRDGKLTSRWVFDSKDGRNPYSGMGNHGISVADVDGDGKDEIVFGSMCVDDNGKGLYTTGLRHGDALHVTDLDPERAGLEVFGVHEIEEETKGPGVAVFDAGTGEILWRGSEDQDVGRGVAANIDNTRVGAQMWWSGSNGLYDIKGKRIGDQPRSTNFLIWWDADLSPELLDGNHIDKYNGGRLFTANDCVANNGTKSTPALSADLFGDWREEVIFRTDNNQSLRIYTTTIPTTHRNYTLMHDPQYRLSVAWQNAGYNQPPHTSFYFGYGMKKAPKPNIILVEPKPTLFVIGDSTVKNGKGKGDDSLWGWADFLADFFDLSRIKVENCALGGTSTRTFQSKGLWDSVLGKLKPGDFVMMQFGHNDGSPLDDTARARGTIKGIGQESKEIFNPISRKKEVVYTYGSYLRKFINDAKAKGAIPIVCSPVPRNPVRNGVIKLAVDNYATWAEEVAVAEKVGFISLNKIIKDKYILLGAEKVDAFFTEKDHTHNNEAGAKVNAASVIEGLSVLKTSPLIKYLKD